MFAYVGLPENLKDLNDHDHGQESRAGNLHDHEYEPAHDLREQVHELLEICGDPS